MVADVLAACVTRSAAIMTFNTQAHFCRGEFGQLLLPKCWEMAENVTLTH